MKKIKVVVHNYRETWVGDGRVLQIQMEKLTTTAMSAYIYKSNQQIKHMVLKIRHRIHTKFCRNHSGIPTQQYKEKKDNKETHFQFHRQTPIPVNEIDCPNIYDNLRELRKRRLIWLTLMAGRREERSTVWFNSACSTVCRTCVVGFESAMTVALKSAITIPN